MPLLLGEWFCSLILELIGLALPQLEAVHEETPSDMDCALAEGQVWEWATSSC